MAISKGWQEPEVELTPKEVGAKARERFSGIDMIDEVIRDELFFRGKASARDLKKVASVKVGLYASGSKSPTTKDETQGGLPKTQFGTSKDRATS